MACDLEEEAEPVDVLPFEPAGPEHAPSPIEMGPYPVGVQTVVFEDPTRTTEGFEGPRQVICEIWYPATDEALDATETYVMFDLLPPDLQEQIPADALGSLTTNALRDAAPRSIGGTFPLVLFSHGKGGVRAQSTFFTVPLASHGYVVVAMDHEGDTIVDLLREGDVAIDTTVFAFIDRPQDILFLLDELTYWEHPIAELIDITRIGISGHSFGALTSLRTAILDTRIKAVVAHAPPGIGTVNIGLEESISDIDTPIIIHGGKMDRTLPVEEHTDTIWPELNAPSYYLTMESAGHFTYSDLCIFDVEALDAAVEMDASNVLSDGCGEENIVPEVGFDVINHFSIGFFNAYLRDSPKSLSDLNQAAADALVTNEVVLQIKE
jgi:predicted dienelactone hydrolase